MRSGAAHRCEIVAKRCATQGPISGIGERHTAKLHSRSTRQQGVHTGASADATTMLTAKCHIQETYFVLQSFKGTVTSSLMYVLCRMCCPDLYSNILPPSLQPAPWIPSLGRPTVSFFFAVTPPTVHRGDGLPFQATTDVKSLVTHQLQQKQGLFLFCRNRGFGLTPGKFRDTRPLAEPAPFCWVLTK